MYILNMKLRHVLMITTSFTNLTAGAASYGVTQINIILNVINLFYVFKPIRFRIDQSVVKYAEEHSRFDCFSLIGFCSFID